MYLIEQQLIKSIEVMLSYFRKLGIACFKRDP